MPFLQTIRHAATVLAASFVLTTTAFAHAHPKTMDPLPDSTVTAPAKITVTFTEPIEPKFSSLTVTDDKGEAVNKKPSSADTHDTQTLVLDMPALKSGAYVVHWVSVAVDGHRMKGEYTFKVK